MKLTTDLPEEIKSFSYVKNHHYIELEDNSGHKHKVMATGLRKGICQRCSFIFYSEINPGDIRCPVCVSLSVEWTWGNLQLCFIPETPSMFDLNPEDE